MSEWMSREANPATAPWCTVRFWLTILGLAISVIALVMAA
jgi:hypothetical protein